MILLTIVCIWWLVGIVTVVASIYLEDEAVLLGDINDYFVLSLFGPVLLLLWGIYNIGRWWETHKTDVIKKGKD